MTSPINDFQDILKAMEHDPALRDTLRRHILTDELLQVPVRLERIEGYVGTLQEGVSTLTADATTLKEGQARLEQGQTELREEFRSANLRINQIAGDMGNLRGNEYERRIRFRVLYRAGAEFGIQSPDIALSQNDPRSPAFQQAISTAMAEGRITQRELEDLGDLRLHHHGDQQQPRRRGGLHHSQQQRHHQGQRQVEDTSEGDPGKGVRCNRSHQGPATPGHASGQPGRGCSEHRLSLERDGPTDHLLAQVKIAVRNATCQKATSAAAGMVRQ